MSWTLRKQFQSKTGPVLVNTHCISCHSYKQITDLQLVDVIDPSVDPTTLCPYCDCVLPTSPSPTLLDMLQTAHLKSQADPRPSNPLARFAPMTVYVDLCHKHQFETRILPEAQAQGWPTQICWPDLQGRIEARESIFQALLDDYNQSSPTEVGVSPQGPRSQSIFWRELMHAIHKNGFNKVQGVQGQLSMFKGIQPG